MDKTFNHLKKRLKSGDRAIGKESSKLSDWNTDQGWCRRSCPCGLQKSGLFLIRQSLNKYPITHWLLSALLFLGHHLSAWHTVVPVVSALWGFAAVMLEVGTLTFVNVFAGEVMFIAANIILLVKIVSAAFYFRTWIVEQASCERSYCRHSVMSWIGFEFAESKTPQDLTPDMIALEKTGTAPPFRKSTVLCFIAPCVPSCGNPNGSSARTDTIRSPSICCRS